MVKPRKLHKGDKVAIISPSWGCMGAPRVRWKYELGVKHLEELGLVVVSAPNALKGTKYLKEHPEKRAEDLLWAFNNKEIKAVIAAIGGNDCEKILPYLNKEVFINNPKIFCGYSDVLAIHLYLHDLGLVTYYGDNLLTSIADEEGWNNYAKKWFIKIFFEYETIGEVEPSSKYSYSRNYLTDKSYQKKYIPNEGVVVVQGQGKVRGPLFGGHFSFMEYENNPNLKIDESLFKDKIFFLEDIPYFFSIEGVKKFFSWMGERHYLQVIKGMVIGKVHTEEPIEEYIKVIKEMTSKFGVQDLPILYGLNFGHTSPIFILPYEIEAEIGIDHKTFSILESGVSND